MNPITFRKQVLMHGITLVLVGLIVFVSTSFASTPPPQPATLSEGQTVTLNQQLAANTTTVSYQGHLADANGTPVNSTLPMIFRIYTTPTGGTPIWTEERSGSNAVPVTNGLFHVMLGSVEPLSTDIFAQDLWLGISVESDSEMTPREKLGSVPTLIPDGSVTSGKLNLDHGTVCLPERVQMELPANYAQVDIPGLSLDFTLDKPSTVLIWIDGLALFNQGEEGGNEQNIQLTLDEEKQSNTFTDRNGQWYNVEGQRLVPLDGGTHTLKAVAASLKPGTLSVHEGGGYRTCINYLVLGEQ